MVIYMKKLLIVIVVLVSLFAIATTEQTEYVFLESSNNYEFKDYYIEYKENYLNTNTLEEELSSNFVNNDYKIKQVYFYLDNYQNIPFYVLSNNVKILCTKVANIMINNNVDTTANIMCKNGISIRMIKINTSKANMENYSNNNNVKISENYIY